MTIANAIEAPLFIAGKTSLKDWRESIRQRPAPWAEIGNNKVILTVPSQVIRKLEDPQELMSFWDGVLDACAELACMSKDRRRPERYVADVQISAGYMHSGYPIMTHLDAAPLMVDRQTLATVAVNPVWGLYHEMGHNHQSGDWTFDGTGEVTVNLFSKYVIDHCCKPAKPLHPVDVTRVRRYLADGADFAKWKQDPFLALMMYDQLREGFGWETYRKVFAEYRALPREQRPASDQDKRDQWMVRFSRGAGRNLGPFFKAWGVPVSEKAMEAVKDLPAWMPADWPK